MAAKKTAAKSAATAKKSATPASEPESVSLRKVQTALERGTLSTSTLSARTLATVLGQSTSVIYHRWGSLDGLLFALGTLGWTDLATALTGDAESRRLKKLGEAYVSFALAQPALYRLMTDHPYDRDALRAAGITAKRPSSLPVTKLLGSALGKRGGDDGDDALLFHAGLHGLTALGADRESTLRAARELARRLG